MENPTAHRVLLVNPETLDDLKNQEAKMWIEDILGFKPKPKGATMQAFIASKIVMAEAMDELTFKETIKGLSTSGEVNREGYHVVYPGNYHSWSPKKAFDESHRLVNEEEKEMCSPIAEPDPS